MADSFELLAKLGIDTSDVEKAKTQLRELSGAASEVFPQASKDFNKAEKALGGVATATQAATKATNDNSKANSANATSRGKSLDNLSQERYALYDVAAAYGAVGASLIAISGYAITTGASFESAFTSVQRTTEGTAGQIEGIRQELLDLSTQIPVSFQDLSAIATLGSQLGVASQDLDAFTETVAKFSAVTGISTESAAAAFGAIGQQLGVSADQYENLGSSIALVGRRSVATEAQIISVTKEISASAKAAGFTADEVVGLAGALSSLQIAPERARGSLDTYIGTLNKAVAEGGPALENFATIVGVTSDELSQMVRNGEGEKVFEGFLNGLKNLDNVDTTKALDALGLSQLRVSNSFGRLAQNIDVYRKAQADASQGFGEGTELANQYGVVVDDLNSQFMIFVNALNALVVEATGGAIPGLAGLLSVLTQVVNALRDAAKNPAVQYFTQFSAILAGVVGVLFAFKAANTLATASTLALVRAQAGLAATGARGGILGLIGALAGYTPAATGAATATQKLRVALLAAGRATLIIGIIQALIEVFFNFNGVARGFISATKSIYNAAFQAIDAIARLINQIATFAQGLSFVQGGVKDFVTGIQNLSASATDLKGVNAQFDKLIAQFPDAADGSEALGASAPNYGDLADGAGDYAGGLGDVGDAAGDAAQEVRTLADYANDLGTVFSRAFDIRFGPDQGLDTITTGWQTIAQATSDANDEIRKYQITIQDLTADKAVKEYFLSVAEGYGDILRAGQIRADLADIDGQLADNNKDLTKAQDKNSKTLVGNTEGAIANRAALLGLVQNYEDYIKSLAASGVSSEDLAVITQQLKQDFIAQATQMGYNQTEVLKYASAFDDLTIAINNVPRNITVSANTNPAIQALNEFLAQANAAKANVQIGGLGNGAGAGTDFGNSFGGAAAEGIKRALRNIHYTDELSRRLGSPDGQTPQSLFTVYATGGFVRGPGTGTSDSIPAMISNGEYVQKQRAVSYYGVPFMNALNNMQIPRNLFASGGYAGPSVARSSSFDSGSLARVEGLLAVIAQRTGVSIGNDVVASATNAGNARLGRLGNG